MPSTPPRRRIRPALAAFTLALGVAACTDGGDPAVAHVDVPDPLRGEVAFRDDCAGCHTSVDGFDLARFTFSDTTILRRATAHVDTATAHDIIAHVRSLRVAPVDRELRLFQPRGEPAVGDEALAFALFGADRWPADWGEAELLAVDPASVAVAVAFPVWSDEGTNLDWMPDTPLPPAVLEARGGWVRGVLGGYAASPTDDNLVRALATLRAVTHDRLSPTAPCAQSDDGALAEPAVCFQVTRWTASLAGQHLMRRGLSFDGDLAGGTRAQDAFWDVGQAARRGLLRNRTPVDNAEENWVSWMMLGWVFAPGNHASVYTASGLQRVGLPRHATFVALRSLVAREAGSDQPYKDLRVAAQNAPNSWLEGVVTSAVRSLEAREARGEGPSDPVREAEAAEALARTGEVLVRRLGAFGAAPLLQRIEELRVAGA